LLGFLYFLVFSGV